MTFSDAAISGKCERRAFIRTDRGYLIQPLGHQIGSPVGEVVPSDRLGRICRKVSKVLMGANLYDIFYFFLDACHLTLERLKRELWSEGKMPESECADCSPGLF